MEEEKAMRGARKNSDLRRGDGSGSVVEPRDLEVQPVMNLLLRLGA